MNFVSKFRNKNLKNILSKLNSFSKHHFEIMANRRGVEKVFENREQAEGVGARVRRSIGTHDVTHLYTYIYIYICYFSFIVIVLLIKYIHKNFS